MEYEILPGSMGGVNVLIRTVHGPPLHEDFEADKKQKAGHYFTMSVRVHRCVNIMTHLQVKSLRLLAEL